MPAVPTRAERQEQTRTGLIDAAERLFTRHGFHATSLDAVAAEAGFTKGAVYSNFESKEDLFFAVYERRLDARIAEFNALIEDAPTAVEALEAAARTAASGSRDDGWLAVFFEFWAHVLRRPELRERFAAHHRRIVEPLILGVERLALERGEAPPENVRKLATAVYAMQTGLQLERLTQPDVVDLELGARMMRLSIYGRGRDGLSDQAAAGLRSRRAREPDAPRT
jgi:AcrR family transcriptional regulator